MIAYMDNKDGGRSYIYFITSHSSYRARTPFSSPEDDGSPEEKERRVVDASYLNMKIEIKRERDKKSEWTSVN